MRAVVKDIVDSMGADNIRMDCPFCHGNKCFSITRDGGQAYYNCFRVSCNAKGTIGIGATIEGVKKKLEGEPDNAEAWCVPEYYLPISANEKAVKYLNKYGLLDLYSKRSFSAKYDPKEDRLCYLIKDEGGKIVGAVGRALHNQYPKVKVFGCSSIPFICGDNPKAILVEDCASAISATYMGYTGVSLNGTNLKPSYLPYLRRFDKLVVALDADAKKKNMSVYFTLCNYFSLDKVSIMWLSKDIKDTRGGQIV